MLSRLLFRTLVFSPFILPLLPSCLKVDDLNPEGEQVVSHEVINKLNKNVEGLKRLAVACMEADSVAIFDIEYNEDGSVLYWLSMEDSGDIELYSEIVSPEISVPEVSIMKDGEEFFWMVNSVYLKDSKGNRISVTGKAQPVFHANAESIYCKINNHIIGDFPITKADYLAKDVYFNYNLDKREFDLSLSSGYKTTLSTISEFQLLEGNVLNLSYYKDVFMDAGIALTSRKSLAAASYLNLSLEAMIFARSQAVERERVMQRSIVAGDSTDSNGRLLYPDGQPRYRMLFVNGGDSRAHGQSLGKKCLEKMRQFVQNGGSYVGTCAGAFFASNGFDANADYSYYLSVWPGMMEHSGLTEVYPGMYIEKDSPLLQYYDFGGDYYVDEIRHNSGGFAANLPQGTEVLARFDYPQKKTVHNQPSIWAYKESRFSGRVVLTGSHPERESDGERRDLTAAMMQYAMDGRGVASLKGFLKNGVERLMDKTTEDNDPAYTRIGDLQTHHFATYIPPDAKNIRVEVSGSSDCDFALMMNQKTYAFSGMSEYSSSVPGTRQQLSFPSIREGIWYISVQCLTTVTVKETNYGQEYGGKTEVLNGVPYTIMISWE